MQVWGHSYPTCCNQVYLNFLHLKVVGTLKHLPHTTLAPHDPCPHSCLCTPRSLCLLIPLTLFTPFTLIVLTPFTLIVLRDGGDTKHCSCILLSLHYLHSSTLVLLHLVLLCACTFTPLHSCTITLLYRCTLASLLFCPGKMRWKNECTNG